MTLLLETLSKNQKAWKKWQGFPTRKSEAFRYVSLKKLEESSDLIAGTVHFEYEAPSEIIVLPLKEARQTYGSLIEKRAALLSQKDKDAFFFLNQAVGSEGLFIYVPPQVKLAQPLKIKQRIETHHAAHPRVEIFLGKGAELTTIVEVEGKKFWNNANLNVTVNEGAHYRHYDVAGHHLDSWDFLSLQGEVKRRATLKVFSFGRGAKIQRRDLAVSLIGEHAEADLKGVSLLDNQLEGACPYSGRPCGAKYPFKSVF